MSMNVKIEVCMICLGEGLEVWGACTTCKIGLCEPCGRRQMVRGNASCPVCRTFTFEESYGDLTRITNSFVDINTIVNVQRKGNTIRGKKLLQISAAESRQRSTRSHLNLAGLDMNSILGYTRKNL